MQSKGWGKGEVGVRDFPSCVRECCGEGSSTEQRALLAQPPTVELVSGPIGLQTFTETCSSLESVGGRVEIVRGQPPFPRGFIVVLPV